MTDSAWTIVCSMGIQDEVVHGNIGEKIDVSF